MTLASKEVSEQYQLLECEFGTSFITQCLNDPENAHSFLQVVLISRDWEIVLEMAKYHQSTKHISDASSWCKLWDDHGVRGTRADQYLEIENVPARALRTLVLQPSGA